MLFKHCGFYSASLVVYNQATVELEDCNLHHACNAAVSCYTASVSLARCSISNCAYGIAAGLHAAATCHSVDISQCIDVGLLISNAANLDFTGGSVAGCNCGIHALHAGSRASLVGCTIQDANGNGVHAHGGAAAKLSDCDVSGCGANALELSDAGTIVVAEASKFRSCKHSGAYLTSAAELKANGCAFMYNAQNGVAVRDAAGSLQMRSCDVSGNAQYGVGSRSNAASKRTMLSCKFSDNGLGHQGSWSSA